MTKIAVVDEAKCNSSECQLECINFCPINRKKQENECIYLDEQENATIEEDLCIGCKICQNKCPFDAISIVNLSQEQGDLIHQYGKNTFRLYNLPAPKQGKVVGLLGRNGIGKSTALNILAGEIKPNLGHYQEEQDWQEIIENFRGTEIQNYLQKLHEDDIEVSYKPQRVNQIKQHYTGKVSDFLTEKVPGLELDSVWDKDLQDLSGGELQRTAIAGTIADGSDIALFDEPSSYLDVRQRLKVAQKIRKLAQTREVLVIEHDLASLDYLSDEIHVLYGNPGVYGVVAQSLTERSGINQFLQGFMEQENVRIRQDSIQFLQRSKEVKKRQTLLKIPQLRKQLGDFQLKTEAGELKKGEVLAAFGRNALGKTTLARLIAGKMEPDSGQIEDISLSYKPQYISPDYSESVRQLLTNKGDRDIYSQDYQVQIMAPFRLEELLDSQVKNLSPGELQRVAVALSLSREAEVYLLDEPTAFLDVEMRMLLAKNLRKFIEQEDKTAIIIDHDLLLLDFIADRALVFEGEPGKQGFARSPQPLRQGINRFLQDLGITFRRDPETGRPRANKQGSQKDKQQKENGNYYCPR